MPRQDEALFTASLNDVRSMCDMLRSLSFKNRAILFIDATGVKVSVEEGRTLQACVWLEAKTFTSFTWNGDRERESGEADDSDQEAAGDESSGAAVEGLGAQSATIEISLHALIECLNVFNDTSSSFKRGGAGAGFAMVDDEPVTPKGPKTSGVFSYKGEGEPFCVILEAQGIVTRCELTTYEVDERLALAFDSDETLGQLIMKSDWFKDLYAEVGSGTTSITFTFAPPGSGAAANLSVEAEGVFGTTKVDYPNDSDVFESCEIRQECSNTYAFTMFAYAKPAVHVSQKISLRVDGDGLLDLQMLVPTTKDKSIEKSGFIQFTIVPQVKNED